MSLVSEAMEPEDGPVIGTIAGEAGMGKTILAATFPKALFLRAEDGMGSIRKLPQKLFAKGLPLVETVSDIRTQLKSVMNDEHDYKTLVIDSVTELEPIFNRHIVDSDKKNPKSINTALGGYGNGFAAVGALHQSIVRTCRMIKDRRGMNIIFIAHAAVGTKDMPDEDPYSRYTLQMNEKYSMPAYTNQVDFVGYIKHELFVRQKDENSKFKATSDGTRLFDMVSKPSSTSKNRYGITEPIPFGAGVNPLINFIPSLKGE